VIRLAEVMLDKTEAQARQNNLAALGLNVTTHQQAIDAVLLERRRSVRSRATAGPIWPGRIARSRFLAGPCSDAA
jgi:hypothetical protein